MIENRGGKEDMQLKEAFVQIYEKGTHNLEATSLQEHLTSRQIKIKPKVANIAGLQLADLLAFPCNRHILKHYGLANYTEHTFSEKLIEILAGKLFCFQGGHCGIRHLPTL
jgi:hypothetical protein